MEFFDCNVCYGVDIASRALQPVWSIGELLHHMNHAGVTKAMACRVEQYTAEPMLGNSLLAEDIRGCDNIYGIWTILPSHTQEMPEPDAMVRQMREKRIYGWRLCPVKLRFLPKVFVLQDWLELGVQRNIPFFINIGHGTSYEALADILEKYPALTVVLSDPSVWPNDRLLRPFVAAYPNIYLDLTCCTTDRGIESFVQKYGSGRLLYGSGFPDSYFGANMLMVKHAEVSEQDKEAIASGNMLGILREVAL